MEAHNYVINAPFAKIRKSNPFVMTKGSVGKQLQRKKEDGKLNNDEYAISKPGLTKMDIRPYLLCFPPDFCDLNIES